MITVEKQQTKTVSGWAQAFVEEPKVNAAVIEYFVSGVKYPASKEAIIKKAEANRAPENVMGFYVYRLPERTYNHPSEISFTAFASAYFFGQD